MLPASVLFAGPGPRPPVPPIIPPLSEHGLQCGRTRILASLQPLRNRRQFLRFLNTARKAEWVVYAKPPMAAAEQVLEYLGRYTHRVVISGNRLVAIEDGADRFARKTIARLAASER